MAELSTGEFAKLHQCTLKHVNAKMKSASITGCKSVFDKRLTLLTEEEQAQLEPYINANRKQTEPEPIADVVGELIDDEPIEPSKNTALTFHVADQDAEILAIRQDTSAIATQTKSNFSRPSIIVSRHHTIRNAHLRLAEWDTAGFRPFRNAVLYKCNAAQSGNPAADSSALAQYPQ